MPLQLIALAPEKSMKSDDLGGFGRRDAMERRRRNRLLAGINSGEASTELACVAEVTRGYGPRRFHQSRTQG